MPKTLTLATYAISNYEPIRGDIVRVRDNGIAAWKRRKLLEEKLRAKKLEKIIDEVYFLLCLFVGVWVNLFRYVPYWTFLILRWAIRKLLSKLLRALRSVWASKSSKN